MASFDIVLETSGSLHPDGEPSDFVSEHVGYILCTRDDDGRVNRVGKVHAYRIHAGLAADHGESLFDVCDAHSHELHVLHTLLYEPDAHAFKERLIDRFEAMEADCLVIDYIVLNPTWRGLKIGLLALRKTIDLLGGGCGLTVCRPAPLNPGARDLLRMPASWLPRHATDEEWNAAVLKLRRYCRQLGFQRLGRTAFYGLSMARKAPTVAELLKGKRTE